MKPLKQFEVVVKRGRTEVTFIVWVATRGAAIEAICSMEENYVRSDIWSITEVKH